MGGLQPGLSSHSPNKQPQEACRQGLLSSISISHPLLFFLLNLKGEKNNEKTNSRKSSRKTHITEKYEGIKLQCGEKGELHNLRLGEVPQALLGFGREEGGGRHEGGW